MTTEKSWVDSPGNDLSTCIDFSRYPKTGIVEEILQKLILKAHEIPENFSVYRVIQRIVNESTKMSQSRQIGWRLAEFMAIGSILLDGHHVRLTGQDVERGTFSHRHHVLHDQEKHATCHVSLNNLAPIQGHYTVCNSPLSEFAALGFELGYSIANPNSLVIWEAQFGR